MIVTFYNINFESPRFFGLLVIVTAPNFKDYSRDTKSLVVI